MQCELSALYAEATKLFPKPYSLMSFRPMFGRKRNLPKQFKFLSSAPKPKLIITETEFRSVSLCYSETPDPPIYIFRYEVTPNKTNPSIIPHCMFYMKAYCLISNWFSALNHISNVRHICCSAICTVLFLGDYLCLWRFIIVFFVFPLMS